MHTRLRASLRAYFGVVVIGIGTPAGIALAAFRPVPQPFFGLTAMRIPTKAIWLSIYRVFTDQNVGAGCSLTLKELMTEWTVSGLRQCDLAEGLDSLSRAGFMSLEEGDEGPCARLLDEQFGLLDAGELDRGVLRALERLREARRRPTHLGNLLEYGEGRRHDDPPFAAPAAGSSGGTETLWQQTA